MKLAPLILTVTVGCSRLPGKTWCQSHLIDWDPYDEQTQEHLKSRDKK